MTQDFSVLYMVSCFPSAGVLLFQTNLSICPDTPQVISCAPSETGITSTSTASDQALSNESHVELDLSFFAEDHRSAELMDLIGCLSVEELKQIAKIMKVSKPNQNVCHVRSVYSVLLANAKLSVLN